MAEILLSLTIIGVVAAITLPSLTGNINERTWATQKKALYARMSQAFPLLDSINTYNTAEEFIAGALNTVTKINNVCSSSNLADCGIEVSTIAPLTASTTLTGTTEGVGLFDGGWSMLGLSSANLGTMPTVTTGTGDTATTTTIDWEDDLMAAFETGNGESIVLYYNPNCTTDQEASPTSLADEAEDWFNYVCVNMVYDLNNNKGPNTVGKDIGFMTVFYPIDSTVVSTVPDISTSTGTAASGEGASAVPAQSASCNSDEYRVPNKYEAMSMALNNVFVTGSAVTASAPDFVTSSKGADTSGTYVYLIEGLGLTAATGTQTGQTRCVKR